MGKSKRQQILKRTHTVKRKRRDTNGLKTSLRILYASNSPHNRVRTERAKSLLHDFQRIRLIGVIAIAKADNISCRAFQPCVSGGGDPASRRVQKENFRMIFRHALTDFRRFIFRMVINKKNFLICNILL